MHPSHQALASSVPRLPSIEKSQTKPGSGLSGGLERLLHSRIPQQDQLKHQHQQDGENGEERGRMESSTLRHRDDGRFGTGDVRACVRACVGWGGLWQGNLLGHGVWWDAEHWLGCWGMMWLVRNRGKVGWGRGTFAQLRMVGNQALVASFCHHTVCG